MRMLRRPQDGDRILTLRDPVPVLRPVYFWYGSTTVNGKEICETFSVAVRSVALRTMVNLPGRFNLSTNSQPSDNASAGTSSLAPVNGLSRVGLPVSSSTDISISTLGCF